MLKPYTERALGHKNQGLCISFKLQIHTAPLFQHQLLLPVPSSKGVLALASLGSVGAHLCTVGSVCVRTLACLCLPGLSTT